MAPINATVVNESVDFLPAKKSLPEVDTENGNGNGNACQGFLRRPSQYCNTVESVSRDYSPSSPIEVQELQTRLALRFTRWYSYETLLETANFLLSKITVRPRIGLICGSGMGSYWNEGSLAESITNTECIRYEDIPNFPVSTVEGHHGRLVFGQIAGVPVVAMQGRFHYYEGYPLWKCCLPVRVMKLLGVKTLIATNAAGGLNPNYKIGDFMIVKDHINMMGFAGNNPLHGPNDERFGPRFPPMNKAYNYVFRNIAKEVAKELKLDHLVREGVYTCLGGPNFETVAELNMLKMVGVDAVGMSTVHEVITARHCDMKVFALSLITNECVTSYEHDAEANHEEVLDVGRMRQETLSKYVSKLVEEFQKIDDETP